MVVAVELAVPAAHWQAGPFELEPFEPSGLSAALPVSVELLAPSEPVVEAVVDLLPVSVVFVEPEGVDSAEPVSVVFVEPEAVELLAEPIQLPVVPLVSAELLDPVVSVELSAPLGVLDDSGVEVVEFVEFAGLLAVSVMFELPQAGVEELLGD